LGPLGTAATNYYDDYDDGEIGGMMIWQGKPKHSEITCPSAALSTTKPTYCLDPNPGPRCEKPATNRLSYGTAYTVHLSTLLFPNFPTASLRYEV
jgi:hypothetical protein